MSDSAVSTTSDQITSAEQLRALVGEPSERVANKVRNRLSADDLDWLAASPLVLIATTGADGSVDVSPKGDPPGFTLVLDDTTIVIPDRPGNRRVDGYLNILQNPHVGLIFLVPGRGDTLRINGQARIVSDAPYFDQLIVKGHRPGLAMVLDVEEVFFHCSKAFLRSQLWKPETWNPDAVASRAQIAHRLERPDDSLETLEKYYGPDYAKTIY